MLVTLSARLEAVLAMLEPCRVLADVGTDHGLIPVAAVQRELAERAIASDLRPAPLEVARQNVERAGLRERVSLSLGDGLQRLTDQGVDALVMAGVSGELMVRVFEATPQVTAQLSQLVLSPNQDVDAVRGWAHAHGFHLRDERMVEERGFFFPLCAYQREAGLDPSYQHASWSLPELFVVGPRLLEKKDATALRAYEEQCVRLGKLVARGVAARAPELALWQRACEALRA